MSFRILIGPGAVKDIQKSIDYYEERERDFGKQFEQELDEKISTLKINPFYQVRYDDVHCLPLHKFPHMIHYTIDIEKKLVFIRAVFHTALSPERWKVR